GLDHPPNFLAAFDSPGDLRNHKSLKFEVTMMLAIAGQALGDLLGGGHTQIRDHGPVQRSRVVEVDHCANKIGTIRGKQLVARRIRTIVQESDKFVVLFVAGLDLEGVESAVVGRADQLNPRPLRHLPISAIWSNVSQMFPAILIAQEGPQSYISVDRNFLGTIHRVEVRNQWNGVPVVRANAVIAAEHHPFFTRLTPAKNNGTVGTDSIQINGHMSCAGKCSIHTERLFEKKSGACVRKHAGAT